MATSLLTGAPAGGSNVDTLAAKLGYMSFEGKNGSGGAGAGGKKEGLPLSLMPTKDYTLDTGNVVCFYGRKNFLSNFYESPMVIGGHMYPSVEHYYEACKVYAVAGPYQAMQLRGCQDPGQVKSVGKRLVQEAGRSKREVEKWKRTEGLLVARVGLMEKFRQNPSLRSRLLKTGDALLVQCNQYDALWAVAMDTKDFKGWMDEHQGEKLKVPACIEADSVRHVPELGKGKNLLGFIIMYVRECMRSEFGTAAVVGQPTSLIPGMKKMLKDAEARGENGDTGGGDGRQSSSSNSSDEKK